MKPKLCYVLPEYDAKSHTHLAYLIDFVKEIRGHFDIFLLIERGGKPDIDLESGRVQAIVFHAPILRFLEIKLRLLHARLLGYRNFYVHYSFFSAFTASFLGRTFYWNCGEPWKYRRNFFREQFERLVYRRIDFLVTGTEGMKRNYAKHYRLPLEKIKVMPNWINLKNIKSQIPDPKSEKLRGELKISGDQKVILFVHRLSRRKGTHFLPEILSSLGDNFVLLVVGDGPEKGNLKSQISNLKLEDRVRFLGWVPHEDLLHYYGVSDVFIMPSEEEGFPHVLLESMAYGVPFVASEVGGVREIIPPAMYNYLVQPDNPDAFVTKIRELILKTTPERDRLKALMREWVLKYDLSKVAARFRELIDD